MAQYIEVKGETIEFPDGMSAQDITAAIKKNMLSVKPEPYKPEDPGFMGTLPIAAGRTFDRIGKGMQQAYYGLTNDTQGQKNLKAQAAEDDRFYKPLQEMRPIATGIGEAAPSMVLPGGGATSLLGNVARLGLAGGIPAALEYGTGSERLTRGIMGAGAAASVPLAGALFKSAKSFAEPLYEAGRNTIIGRTMNRVAGDDAGNVIARLTQGGPVLPGSMPTVGQLAENGGINALERSAAQSNPAAYTARAMEQSAARRGALSAIAGDDAQMAAAIAARKNASDALYKQADTGMAPIDSMFNGLKMRPQFNAALKSAEKLAKDNGLNDLFFRDKDGKPIALLGEGAHYIKKALDDAGEYGSSSYAGKNAASAANKTNEIFQTWLEKSIPEYGAAKAAFAEKSVPINRMEVGQALYNKAAPALADYGALANDTGATFAKALRDGDNVAARATGFSGSTIKNVLSPEQFATVENIAKDLARKANAQGLARDGGSDTFQKLSMQNIAQQSGMPNLVGGLLDAPGVSRATKWVYRDADEKTQKMMAEALLDPKKAAELMKSANNGFLKDKPELRKLLEQTVIRGGGLLGVSALPNE